MKKLLVFTVLCLSFLASFACPVCERNKKNALERLTHGGSPNGYWDYVIVAIVAAAVLATLFFSIKYLIKPNEDNKDHIKYLFIN